MINLNRKLKNLERTPRSGGSSKKKGGKLRFYLLVFFVIVGIVVPAWGSYNAVKELNKHGRLIVAAAKTQNLDEMRSGLKGTKSATNNLNTYLNFLVWMRLIPYFGTYYSDLKHFVTAASYQLEAAETIMVSLDPYKNELGLTGQPNPTMDKVVQATKILDKVLPSLNKIEPSFRKARQEVEDIDTGKYPDKVGSIFLRSRLEEAKNLIVGADIAVSQNKQLLEVAPSLLGQPNPKNYLLLFQNDKELRATGGFITAYAFLRMDKGNLATTASDDIYRLDERLLQTCQNKICPLTPPAPIVKYLPEANGKPRQAWSMRDSNLSPDLPTSIEEFERMYRMLGDKVEFDGIITIDTQVVEELIVVTGPIEALGTTYSASTDKRCNCPNVIYELEHYAEIASKGEADRKAVVGALMQQLLGRLLAIGPERMPTLINTGVKLANDKHVMLYMHDAKTQAALSKINWTGEIKTPEGDYLHLNDSNFAGGKSNLYVEEKVTLEINIDKEGQVKNKVTIEYKNPQPFNTWLNGILRDYVRLYVPQGSKLVVSKGSDEQVKEQLDKGLDKTYFEAFITVRPQNSRVLSFEYTLPEKVSGKNYPLLIQKQPGAKDHKYTIKINGNKKAEFELTSDKELNLSF